jgi:acetyltransferase-like isoleucine patch superfamily enzyme
MLNLVLNYFTLNRLKLQYKNRNISFLMFYDKATRISYKSSIQRFVIMRESDIDDYSYIAFSSNLYNTTVGKFCSISSFVNIGLGTHPTKFLSTSPIFVSKNNAAGHKWVKENVYNGKPKHVSIGNDVWIGTKVSIMGGVKVGNGAIIGAHSVVTKDVPSYAIVGGVPAKILKYRFHFDIIKKLEALSWWNLAFISLLNILDFFQSELAVYNINLFISKIEQFTPHI